MAEYLIQGETLTGIADAIREKTGETNPIAVSDMAAQIEGIQAGGGDIDALIDRSITEVESNVGSIGSRAFYDCRSLLIARFPKVKTIKEYAFYCCTRLKEISFPEATTVDNRAFYNCEALTNVVLPEVTTFHESNGIFHGCTSLTTITCPKATSVPTMSSCSALVMVNFPEATKVGSNAFFNSNALPQLDFPKVTAIFDNAFKSCSSLSKFILRNPDAVCTLANTGAFNSTPIASGTGYIYVPKALIEDYKVATNWSTYAAQFRALEDYTVDGTTTGELDPNKI